MEFKRSGLPVTKYTCMALISAYAACGQFEKAKKVILCGVNSSAGLLLLLDSVVLCIP